ncbi:response regulator [Kovacikia minuta CCNUW1]|uniref:hybrid sensor histidine kinase/response regulator n=1 Tax=Kovacikia minuta TaxID=2931930 RepID=UPI001CCFD740|nr:response regulator [Kovacikia minuta]UBF29247.1 response regulator [Kovacikia minuta CCNUW1]
MNRLFAEILWTCSRLRDLQAIAAEDGQVGVELAQKHLPDLIICDVMMPKLDGFAVLEKLQATPITGAIPFIFLTARAELRDFRRGMSLGADDYLTKPFTRAELLEAIATRLTKHAAFTELQHKLEEFQQSSLLKDDFINTVAHELRSPLATMKMAIEMLQLIPDAKRRQSYLKVLQTACDREVEIINDLLDLQRLEAQTEQDDLEMIDLQNWILPITESFKVRAQQRQQTIQVCLAPNLPSLLTNPSGLGRVLTELFNNACKYTSPGGSIILNVIPGNLESGARSQGSEENAEMRRHGDAEISIQNSKFKIQNSPASPSLPLPSIQFVFSNEAEIPAEALPQVFERFYRVPNGDRWHQGGTGLGLSLVKKFIERMNGTIQVCSKAGWTHFTIQLPLMD